jgi:hypothetical protein
MVLQFMDLGQDQHHGRFQPRHRSRAKLRHNVSRTDAPRIPNPVNETSHFRNHSLASRSIDPYPRFDHTKKKKLHAMKHPIVFAPVNSNGDHRIRRNHAKSRNGCVPCKLNRVKCDEQLPRCGACERKDAVCKRSNGGVRSVVEHGQKEAAAAPPVQRDLNLLHLKLLHWFEHHTAPTLVLRTAWAKVIPLALSVRPSTSQPIETS